jgi:hypothetical protein
MRLLDNLEGVTPSTFPKNPIAIVNEIVEQQKCKYVFEYRMESRQALDTTALACGACIDVDYGTIAGHMLSHVIAKVRGPGGRLAVL